MSAQENKWKAQGERIRMAREARDWSQRKLAEEAGVSENTVLSAEQGKRKTQGEKVRAIFDALGMAALEDDTLLDLADVPADARAFLRVAAQRFAGMEERVRPRLLNELYARLIVEEPVEHRMVREAREAREAELGEVATTDAPGIERDVTNG